ncbi:hypothetical protein CMALT394_100021 [Carnobacterium maltaromaticum]|nr:hypothetical protein CMALT394_100021 [Carnobacterium maltaromaticum]
MVNKTDFLFHKSAIITSEYKENALLIKFYMLYFRRNETNLIPRRLQ